MIPILDEQPGIRPEVLGYLEELRSRDFDGQIETHLAARLAVATDNSVYQVLPDAVVFPRSTAAVEQLAQLLGEDRHRQVTAVPRGGGTGTNGQALAPGVVVDLSRHLRKIGPLDLEAGWVEVQPGVVLDELNAYLKPHGFFFAPNLSPSNRATLGGMVATNASGKGSRVYGRTADHVRSVDLVLVGGTRLTLSETTLERAEHTATIDAPLGRITRTVLDSVCNHARAISQVWPDIPRSLTGYDLSSVLRQDRFSLIPVVCGSEGTLGFVVSARLSLTPIAKARRLLAIRYASFEHALGAAELLVSSNPTAIETIDDCVIDLARKDAIWHKVSDLLGTGEELGGVNLVEFTGNDAVALDQRLERLTKTLDAELARPDGCIGYQVVTEPRQMDALWELRKKGVGLLGAMRGQRRPVPFVEDTAVPPARLAEYVRDFRALLDGAGLKYGMFGHVDAGCLHVRPALDLRDPEDEARLRWLSDRVLSLVRHYGGVFWGEHGKGFRSEYVPEVFGAEVFAELCRVKAAFDPTGQLNPGKLAVVPGSQQKLVSIDAPKRGALDRQIPPASQARFDVAIYCNGNGQCFSTNPDQVMCPSSKLRRDRIHSPKGRAALLREWLRLLGKRGVDAGQRLAELEIQSDPLLEWVDRFEAATSAKPAYDYSHEVYQGLDGCLSCKACATDCPINVDVARMKSDFLALYHQRYLRPLRDYFVAGLEWVLAIIGRLPRFFDWWMSIPLIKLALERQVGIVDAPRLAPKSLERALSERGIERFDTREFARASETKRKKTVLVLQDAFTTFYEPNVVLDAVELMKMMGYRPMVVPYFANGKALHIKGFLRSFRRLAARNRAFLHQLSALGVPLVGIEPAVTLTYRDEYRQVLGEDSPPVRVELLQDWLDEHRDQIEALAPRDRAGSGQRYLLFGHCTEKTAEPAAQGAWQRVFAAAGLDLDLAEVGCCGMCGVFGHEAAHAEESRGIYKMSWQPKLAAAKASGTRVVVPGHSCRSQVHRVDDTIEQHPVQALIEALRG